MNKELQRILKVSKEVEERLAPIAETLATDGLVRGLDGQLYSLKDYLVTPNLEGDLFNRYTSQERMYYRKDEVN